MLKQRQLLLKTEKTSKLPNEIISMSILEIVPSIEFNNPMQMKRIGGQIQGNLDRKK